MPPFAWCTVQHVAGVLSESEMEWTCAVPARVLGESWPTKHSKANQAAAVQPSETLGQEDLKQHTMECTRPYSLASLTLTKGTLWIQALACRGKNNFRISQFY